MSWEDRADLALRAGIQAFKIRAKYIRRADPGSPISISGVWDAPNHDVDPSTGAQINSVSPELGIRLKDLPEYPKAGDKVKVKGKFYAVIEPQDDGQGGCTLILNESDE